MASRRQVEAVLILSVACVIAVGTVCLVIRHRNQYITETVPRAFPACNVSLLFYTSLDPLMAISSGTDWEESETEHPGEDDYTQWVREPYSDPNCKCVRKCCQKGYIYDTNWECKQSKSKSFQLYSQKMCPIRYKSSPKSVVIENILYNYECPGALSRWFSVLEGENFKSDKKVSQIDESLFCLESVNWENAIYIMKCSDLPLWLFKLRACGQAVSALFSGICIYLYSKQPAFCNFHGKALMCYMTCLLMAQVTMPIHETDIFTNNDPMVCKVLAFLVQISSLASAFWLNVLCFDTWWVFSGITRRQLQWKTFLLYSCYAWGGTAVITTVAAIMDLLSDDSLHYIRPKFGYLDCWFNDKHARVLYNELPIGVLLFLILLMFATTIYRLRTYEEEESGRDNRERNQRIPQIFFDHKTQD